LTAAFFSLLRSVLFLTVPSEEKKRAAVAFIVCVFFLLQGTGEKRGEESFPASFVGLRDRLDAKERRTASGQPRLRAILQEGQREKKKKGGEAKIAVRAGGGVRMIVGEEKEEEGGKGMIGKSQRSVTITFVFLTRYSGKGKRETVGDTFRRQRYRFRGSERAGGGGRKRGGRKRPDVCVR